jgi:alkylresorcinol/alkylpyrone synthase
MPSIAVSHTALPGHFCSQEQLTELLAAFWPGKASGLESLLHFHRAVRVDGRYLALPLQEYHEVLQSFQGRNDAWTRVAVDLGTRVIEELLESSSLSAADIDLVAFTTVTGIAVPSIEARLMNRIPFRSDLKRMPLFGLGCLGGVAGLSRLNDYLVGHPRQNALLLSIELCSLTLQPDDLSPANLVSSGLFGDGAAAVLVRGDELDSLPSPQGAVQVPRIVASRSVFFPETERVMGWDLVESGFRVVLSPAVPEYAKQLRGHAEDFLREHGLAVTDVERWVAHPGGPKVMQALEQAFELHPSALDRSWRSLSEVGNLSSASVLFILHETLREPPPAPGSYGLMLAMGPAFCAEMILLQW